MHRLQKPPYLIWPWNFSYFPYPITLGHFSQKYPKIQMYQISWNIEILNDFRSNCSRFRHGNNFRTNFAKMPQCETLNGANDGEMVFSSNFNSNNNCVFCFFLIVSEYLWSLKSKAWARWLFWTQSPWILWRCPISSWIGRRLTRASAIYKLQFPIELKNPCLDHRAHIAVKTARVARNRNCWRPKPVK